MALTPPPAAPQRGDRTTFASRVDAFITWLINFVTELVALVANLDSIAAGGAYAIPYKFSSSTADTDPGVWWLRLNSATQGSVTVIRVSNIGLDGKDWSSLYDSVQASTSATKGSIKVTKLSDPSKWIVFDITGGISNPGGYRNIIGTVRNISGANPFADGDGLILQIQRTGDKGDTGNSPLQLLAQSTVSTTVANIDFLNVFTSAYDKYVIELSNYQPSAAALLQLQLAVAGAVNTASSYTPAFSQGAAGSGTPNAGVFASSNTHSTSLVHPGMTFEISNVNVSASVKSVGVRGVFYNSSNNYEGVGGTAAFSAAGIVTGFRLLWNGGSFAKATVRVYGIKNS
jgi:hypothetical protein